VLLTLRGIDAMTCTDGSGSGPLPQPPASSPAARGDHASACLSVRQLAMVEVETAPFVTAAADGGQSDGGEDEEDGRQPTSSRMPAVPSSLTQQRQEAVSGASDEGTAAKCIGQALEFASLPAKLLKVRCIPHGGAERDPGANKHRLCLVGHRNRAPIEHE
jgi:hypothetical protein